MPRGAAHQLNVNARRRIAVPGMLATTDRRAETEVYVNSDPEAAEVYTLVIDNAVNDQVYGLDVTDPFDTDVTFTADGSATVAEIADGLADAWNTNPLARSIGEAVSDGVDTITITGVFAGVAFTVAEDEGAADMTLTNTTDAAEANPVPFGRALISLAYQANYPHPLGILAASTALTAQVDTLTVTFEAAENYDVGIEVDGQRFHVTVDADTDTATTCTNIAAALNDILPANTVLADGSSGTTVVLTAELAGQAFVTSFGAQNGNGNMTLANTTSGPATDFNQVFAGVSLWTYDEAQRDLTTEAAEYAPNSGVETVRRGEVWVENTEGITNRAVVYVELDGTGDDAGKFFLANSATRVRVDPKFLRWATTDFTGSDADVALLRVDLAA